MTDRRFTERLRLSLFEKMLAIAVAVSLSYAACGEPSYADAPKEFDKVGCRVGPVVVPCRYVSVARLRKANVERNMAKKLRADLMKCSRSLVRHSSPEPRWRIAVRWTAIGLAVGSAFALGVMAGR